MVVFMPRKSESKRELAAPSVPQRLTVFGPPLLLAGEDAAAYDELLARMCAAVKPGRCDLRNVDRRRSGRGVGGPPMAPVEMDFDARART